MKKQETIKKMSNVSCCYKEKRFNEEEHLNAHIPIIAGRTAAGG